MVSVIIPVYNEEKTILDCLLSISKQNIAEMEVIVVDDGSEDNSKFKIQPFAFAQGKNSKFKNLKILTQLHQGPGIARNLGANHAKGEILVFVDSDMTFDKNFIKNLIEPIIRGGTKGTFTKDEYVSNWDNIWARCWNYNEGISDNRRIPKNFPNTSPVFRAILKSEFIKIGGFDDIGFTDDWTLSRKLGYQASVAKDAICYHCNPETLKDVYTQARWIGKNEFIAGRFWKRVLNLFRFNLLFQTIRGVFIALRYRKLSFLVFQFVYYAGINVSILGAFIGETKSK